MIKLSISIDVSNIKQAEDFYIKALGCKKLRDQAGMSVISVENCDIYLQEKEARSAAAPTETAERNYSRHWTPVHIDFLTENVDEIVKRIVKLGGKHEGGERGDWGTIAYCSDPFGNGFCVINE
ncbi:VOC family protein [Microbulbifer sp. MKSA007]|nr:VOC family protein [Microbulbifer sp. MKSA007]